MRRGDLVKYVGEAYSYEDRVGVILTWVRYGGPEGAVWEVLLPDGIEYWDENDLEVVSERR